MKLLGKRGCGYETFRRSAREQGQMGAFPTRCRRRHARMGCDRGGGVRAGGPCVDGRITHAEVTPQVAVEVKCEASDIEFLFVEWLNAIIYEMAVRRMLFGRFAVRIDGGRLEGTLWGEPVDVARHARPASRKARPTPR